ncbi:MAG TPA: LytTR family DNA-binding domain-containing protein [Burkholderiaceae bacterium]|jgi:two-component system LytT family response regulator|nr:LytTR family DNA-binding domain-containing protein [Burkholderiaceae bacterium]
MRALIIDDERLARDWLRRLLQAHPEVRIVGEAANLPEAVRAIESLAPDLIFLDVQMPGGSGFDLLAALDQVPAVIFTTAFDSYAMRAFDVSALDYVLKPIEPQRLALALEKYQRSQGVPDTKPLDGSGKVFIKDGERCWLVELDRIMLFESEGNYTRVYFDNERPLLARSLNQLEARLDPARFTRVSRSQIVNMRVVADMRPGIGGGMVLTLNNGLRITMSRRRAAQFKQSNRL